MAHTDPHAHASHSDSVAVGHEITDDSLGGVEKFMAITFVLLALSFVLSWGFYKYFWNRELSVDVQPSSVVPRNGDRLPPQPRLQKTEPQDLADFHTKEEHVLDGWKWVDKEA